MFWEPKDFNLVSKHFPVTSLEPFRFDKLVAIVEVRNSEINLVPSQEFSGFWVANLNDELPLPCLDVFSLQSPIEVTGNLSFVF